MMEKCKANKRWETTSLNHLCDIYTGNSISDSIKNNYTDKNEAHPYLSSKDIDAITSKANYNNGLWIKNDDCNFKVAKTGSTLMCIEGGSAGKKKTFLRQDVSFVNKLCCFYSNSLNSKYLFYWLSNPEFEQLFNSNISGLIGGVTVGKIKSFKITYPSDINEQQKIADFLDEKVKEIDNAIEKTKETIELYKKYKQAIITEAVTKGLDPNVEMKDSGIDWIKEIPSQWKKIRIKHLFELRNERNYAPLKSVNLLSLYSDIGVIQHDDIEEDVISGNKAINADGYKIVYAGDIVDNIILCWMGAIGISEYNGVTSPAYDIYKPIDETVFTKYFHYLFRTKDFGQKCYTLGRGIMRMRWRVYSEQFMSIYVPVPSFEEQKKIVKSIEANEKNINNMIEAKEYVITKLQSYKQSLIYEYVTGKKEVK